jgi:hypothetical protein
MISYKEIISKFQNEIDLHSGVEMEVFSFHSYELPDYLDYEIDIREDEKFTNHFKKLNSFQGHCLYWFELSTNEDAVKLMLLLNNKRQPLWERELDKRKVPVDNLNLNSTVLYVGVRQGGKPRIKDGLTNKSGRIIQHLGYYLKGSTQGLQLIHWAREANVDIKINVIHFGGIQKEYLYILEKLYALELKPLCGKH